MTYYRTAHGRHRHASWYCANSRRAIRLGEPIAIPVAEVDGWAACEHCCTAAEVAASAQTATQELCPNRGVTHPQRYRSTCRTCGKEGAVNRSTGALRAHHPAPEGGARP